MDCSLLLTPKQEKFCAVYIETSNATEAYRQAYDVENMKPATINRRAKDLLDNGKIRARIDEVMVESGVTAHKVLKRLLQGNQFDIRKLYNEDGSLKGLHELDDDTAKSIVGAKYHSDGTLSEYKIIDVKGCSELLGKHLKLFTDKVDLGGQKDNPINATVSFIDGKLSSSE